MDTATTPRKDTIMKAFSGLIVGTLLALVSLTSHMRAQAPLPQEIFSKSAVLMDAETGQVLYNKNMNQIGYPASITKIMTGLLLVESCEMDEMVTVSASAVALPYGTSHIALDEGERLSVGDAMYAMMLPSANDSANALAEHVAGNQEDFAQRMTQRARELGARNTSFTNAHGLHGDNHYTTAYDMALITRAAAQSETFMEYIGTGRYTMGPTNKQSEPRPFTNQQYMLLPDLWCYNPDVLGGKVGYTTEAKHTMSTVAQRNGRTLVCVVMGSGIDQKFDDTQALLDFGFGEFSDYAIPAGQVEPVLVPLEDSAGIRVGSVQLSLEDDVTLLLHSSVNAEGIEMAYDCPDRFEEGGDFSGGVTLQIPAGETGVPGQQLRIPMEAKVILYTQGVGIIEPEDNASLLHAPAAAPLLVAACALLLLLPLRARLRRRHKGQSVHRRKAGRFPRRSGSPVVSSRALPGRRRPGAWPNVSTQRNTQYKRRK